MPCDYETFAAWAMEWMSIARYHGDSVPDPDVRIKRVVALWKCDIPGNWQRSADQRLLTSDRYCRTHGAGHPGEGGEHEIEHQILEPDPLTTRTDCLGADLVDGVNAVPLSKDPGGGRIGNVEADMLLLNRGGGGYRQMLVEVKSGSDNAWFAVVENLRQMRLFSESDAARQLFQRRRNDPDLSSDLPTTAVVLAPPAFYTAPGQKAQAVPPALALLREVSAQLGIECCLATWEPDERRIALYPDSGPD